MEDVHLTLIYPPYEPPTNAMKTGRERERERELPPHVSNFASFGLEKPGSNPQSHTEKKSSPFATHRPTNDQL